MRASLKLIVPAALALLAAGCGKPSQTSQSTSPDATATGAAAPESGSLASGAPIASTTPAPPTPTVQTAAASPPATSAPTGAAPGVVSGDAEHGKILFAQCRSCHTVVKDGADMTGPSLHGLFGRKVAGKPGYNYSAALRGQSFTWDKAHLDTWLINPRADVPGTKMTFLGFPDAKDRADVIAYLATATVQ